MVGLDYRLNGHEFEQTQGEDEGQGSLESCSPQGHKESDMTEGLSKDKNCRRCRSNLCSGAKILHVTQNGQKINYIID